MRICVPGAAGFAGGQVGRLLCEGGDEVRVSDRELLCWGVRGGELAARYAGRRLVAGR